jgi:hypothetical protein
MIYFTTNSDGNHTEGIGAMAQYQIVCYVLSKLYNTEYYFTGFKNLTHYQYFDITQDQFNQDINNFFNFPIQKLDLPIINFTDINQDLEEFIKTNDEIIINFPSSHLMSFIDCYIDDKNIINILNTIHPNIKLDDSFKYYDKEKTNIAIHIRKYTETDCDLNPRREYFNKDKQHFYLELIKNLNTPNTEFHIYSQGEEKDFDFLKRNNIFLHIEENPLISLYHMINSDILVTANSSLSYIAHLIGSHEKCYVRDTFFHKWKLNTIKL